MSKKLLACLPAAALMAAAPGVSFSQTAPGGDVEELRLEEIVVTAQRRKENLQEVPIAVQAVTFQQVQALGISDPSQLQLAVPSLDFKTSNGGAIPTIRGVGTSSVQVGNESPVATYVDGVYYASLDSALFSFNNIERIEVLKGPQGTLFGRNASGGVINITTRDPGFTPSGRAEIGYGNYDTFTGSVYATTGITDTIAADLAVTGKHQGDGFGSSPISGQELYKPRELAVRSKVLAQVGEATEVRLMGSYSKMSGHTVGLIFVEGSVGLDKTTTQGDFHSPRINSPEASHQESWSAALRVDHDFNAAQFVSITSLQGYEGDAKIDFDATPLPFISTDRVSSGDTFTQELQLLSGADAPFQWILGAYYFDSSASTDRSRLSGLATAPRQYVDRIGTQDVKSLSGFGQATVDLVEDTSLTLGLRNTRDKKKLDAHSVLSDIGKVGQTNRSDTFSKWTWRAALDHTFTPGVLGYVSASRGFKSGNYITTAPNNPVTRPEILDAYEVGLKSELFNRRLRLNTAAFYYDYKNIQLDRFLDGVIVPFNAAAATIKGFEVELDALITRDFSVQGGFTLLDGEYDDFPNAPSYVPNPNGGNVVALADASGLRTIRTPKLTLSLNGIYTIPTDTGDVEIAAGYSYSGAFDHAVLSNARQDAYSLVNASVTWRAPSGGYYVRAWGKNLLDEEYYTFIIPSTFGTYGTPSAPRTYGITIGGEF